MRIKVIRAYSGDEGVGPDKDVHEGTEHTVTRARGSQLRANGLVEILSDDDADSGEEADIHEDQQEDTPMTADIREAKVAPAPDNKKAREPRAKASVPPAPAVPGKGA